MTFVWRLYRTAFVGVPDVVVNGIHIAGGLKNQSMLEHLPVQQPCVRPSDHSGFISGSAGILGMQEEFDYAGEAFQCSNDEGCLATIGLSINAHFRIKLKKASDCAYVAARYSPVEAGPTIHVLSLCIGSELEKFIEDVSAVLRSS